MTPTAVLVLVVGVLVVLAVAGTALALDARRRRGPRSSRRAPVPPLGRAPRPSPEPAPHPLPSHHPEPSNHPSSPPVLAARQTEPIDTVRAQQDPPTVMTGSGRPPVTEDPDGPEAADRTAWSPDLRKRQDPGHRPGGDT